MNNNQEHTGDKIRRYRLEKGLTQKQLAEKCGMYESQIRKYETGKANPKIQTLQKIANALGVPTSDLLEPATLQLSKDVIDLFAGKPLEIIGEMIREDNERFLISDYRQLNTVGKKEALKRVSELTEIKKYTEKEKPRIQAVYKKPEDPQ